MGGGVKTLLEKALSPVHFTAERCLGCVCTFSAHPSTLFRAASEQHNAKNMSLSIPFIPKRFAKPLVVKKLSINIVITSFI